VIPGPILLMGAPGVGKGTQAKGIMAAWGVPQISTGDLLRDNRVRGTALGRQATQVMDEGKLVPDDLVNQMVAERLAHPDTVRGYILDGYPRTLAQAEWLDDRLAADPAALPLIAVSIQVSYTQLLRRITGRRNCPTCQRIYNVYLQPPKFDTVCDVEGTSLVQRADDTEAVFHERMRTYTALTAPVVEHYRAWSRFVEVNGEQPAGEVMADIMAAVARLRSRI
jgi:adenylate kinase